MIDPLLTAEMRETAASLPLYNGGSGVDYSAAPHAYAVNVTLLHGRDVLLVQRGGGDGVVGSWSGVSGFIDTPYDPSGRQAPQDFDPVRYTAHNELLEECGLSPADIGRITLKAGRRFAIVRGERQLHLLPMLGVVIGQLPLEIRIDGKELTDYRWCDRDEVHKLPDLSPGYLERTLPGALAAE